MPESSPGDAGTIVLGEGELAIGFRLIGMKDVVEVTPETAGHEFQKAMTGGKYGLVVASQSVRKSLTDAQRSAAEASLAPLVVFVPGPTGEYEVESVEALAKRILGVTLAMPK